jgi:hypothetical protein
MNSQRAINKDNFMRRNMFSFIDRHLISLFVNQIHSSLKKDDSMLHLNNWNPVQMGWFTSCYCSCRSRIG